MLRRSLALGLWRAWFTRLLAGTAVAWLIFAGVVLGRYADEAVPTSHLLRPLAVAVLLAVPIGSLGAFSGRWAAAVAAAGALTVVVFVVGYVVTTLLTISIGVTTMAARRGRQWPVPSMYAQAALIIAAAFFLLALVRAAAFVDPPGQPNLVGARQGTSLYLVLLDGYPRADTLSHDLGFDNAPFLGQLVERGFDLYEDARSARKHTELTLVSMLNASAEGVLLEPGTAQDKRAARRRLDQARLPALAMDAGYEYVVIDSPAGHVTFESGTHIRHGGLTTFEERLLAESWLGEIVAAAAPHWLTTSLRAHLDDSVSSVVELTEPGQGRLILAHLMAPHLPLLYAADGSDLPIPSYWPAHPLFASPIEDIGVSVDYYREMYPGHLAEVNHKVLEMVDAMLARDPDAVIVLFSDHGARYSFDVPEEWQRSFLAARTPGHASLFGESPTTTMILCDLFVAYLGLPCE